MRRSRLADSAFCETRSSSVIAGDHYFNGSHFRVLNANMVQAIIHSSSDHLMAAVLCENFRA
jgi:hypothetical protein